MTLPATDTLQSIIYDTTPAPHALRELLAITGMLDTDDTAVVAGHWAPHDRFFAAALRFEDSDVRAVPTFIGEPPPARRPRPPRGERVFLSVPEPVPESELGTSTTTGPAYWEVTERRRSVRTFSPDPLPFSALGELLWRTLRVVRHVPRDEDNPQSYEMVFRPVGSGGAMHANDLWLLCDNVAGVPRGVWWYDPFEHALQLAAVALGLGMCPWGSGSTTYVAELLGIDPELDSPVGEFVLGIPTST